MMKSSLGRKRMGRHLLGAVLCIGLLMAGMAGSARADDDEEDVAFDTKILRQILVSLGLRSGGNGVDYRERSPLVVPPTRNLPPPARKAAGEKIPAWPVDQDVKRRKESKTANNSRRSIDWDADTRPMSPTALRGSSKGNGEAPDNSKTIEAQGPMKPSELGYKGGLFSSLLGGPPKEEYQTFTGEAPRTSLIEPPSGYRTPSPYQPYGVGREKWVPTVIDKHEPVR